MLDYAVTFATLNCLDYTQQCVDSLIASGVDKQQIVAVDNASTDGTQDYLQSLDLGGVVLNKDNLSCGAAWNQGILALQAEWTIVMNNDIVVTQDFAKNLIEAAQRNNLRLISPARIDGAKDYDFPAFASMAQTKMRDVLRLGGSNAICMCMHWSLFKEIGFFRADPNLLGFEDGLFYHEVRKRQIQHASTGAVWVHHYGSVTQEHMKMVLGMAPDQDLVKHNDRKLYHQSWISRKLHRMSQKKLYRQWRSDELAHHQMTLHGARVNEGFLWL